MKQYYFVFCQDAVLVCRQEDGTYSVPIQEEPPTPLQPWTNVFDITPMADGTPVKAYSVDSPVSPETTGLNLSDNRMPEMVPLRQSYYKLPTEQYLKGGKCRELLYWDHETHYCGICGGSMKMHTNISKHCTQCGKEVWPQLATAVIALIHRGDEVLLVRARNFRSDFYGLVAGFVETGETLEEAIAREAMEETGISIGNIRYFASQPWPYPCGLMVGFNADYTGGSLHLQHTELSTAGWFRRDNLPKLPEKLSIARRLIDAWLGER